ncbi:hypothetical protein KAI87_00225, partial [Myxococcota bacterium]|nr:hypothetical protein [Myxococcota bacterium]
NSNLSWELLVVDDGCPDGSGKVAEEIIARQKIEKHVRVLYLQDAISQGLPVAADLSDTSQSQKGGSILYGMSEAAKASHDNHIVIYTDADLSTHLGQCGLLVEPIVHQQKIATLASRREAESVVVKTGTRNSRGKLFIFLWKQMLKGLALTDTQCGFKAFDAKYIPALVDGNLEKKFAFDIELLLKTHLQNPDGLAVTPLAWIDSEAASTTKDLQPYLGMLKSVAGFYRHYLPKNAHAESYAEFIEELNEEGWQRLVDNVPELIANGEPSEFSQNMDIGIEAFRDF